MIAVFIVSTGLHYLQTHHWFGVRDIVSSGHLLIFHKGYNITRDIGTVSFYIEPGGFVSRLTNLAPTEIT